jgi:uncharacterized protein (DUF433 family)
MTTPFQGTDWSHCDLVERVPGKVSGRPVVKGTRIFPDTIVNSFMLGDSVEELMEGFPSLSRDQIEGLIRFAATQKLVPAE